MVTVRICLLSFFGFGLWLNTAAGQIEVGVAVRVITPDPLLPVSGGLGPTAPAREKRGELTARAMVVASEDVRVAIVSIDALGFPSVLGDRARALVPRIEPENILIGATHTHSAPDCYAFPDERGGHTGDLAYMDSVSSKIGEAINEALDNLRPAFLRVATGEAEGKIAYNYYAPDLYDRRVNVLQAVEPDGAVIATLVNYAVHPEVLGAAAGIVSPDLVGPLCERIEERVGGVALFMNGAQGGMITADNRDLDRPRDPLRAVWHDERTWDECVRIGHLLADESLRVLAAAPLQEKPTLYCDSRLVRFPVESDALWAVVKLSPLKYPHDDADRSVSARINLVNVGNAQILTIPGEALPNIGFYLKRKMRGEHNLLFGLTNDAFGYILTKVDFHSFPRYDYVSRVSLGEMTGEIYIEHALDLVQASPMLSAAVLSAQDVVERPFGDAFADLDSDATGRWWEPRGDRQPRLMVPREEVVAFALYTHDHGVLKLSAQLYPLLPDEPRVVRLEFQRDGQWQEVAAEDVNELGWSAHFRVEDWDNSQNVRYRVRHGENASFEGLIRRDPADKDVIVLGSLSCNSSRTPGSRARIVENLMRQDPDVLLFAGDQSYHHTQHTFGWLEWGVQFRDVLRDRPVITIPDDHDVGQGNIWGEGGKKAATPAGPDGGYFYPAEYVNMVQRCQTWHLPDPFDATPVERGIGVYYTNLRVGGVDLAIVEDRKFKSGPEGKIPQLRPQRPDHINDPAYDRKSVDVPGLKLLGERQLAFLRDWSQNWEDAQMKAVLSQTAFCGAVHLHGTPDNRLLADLDSNAWPQTGRRRALAEIRQAWAVHVCGDQHLAVVVKHGIDEHRDGPYGFTSPAIVNTIYGRWWRPADERPGANPIPGSPLPWTGDYEDGLGNPITMLAYANPEDRTDELKRADGYGIVRFNKNERTITFECWPRFADVADGDAAQFPGWPITVRMEENDGRTPVGWLPEVVVDGTDSVVVQVVEESTGDILYTVRARSNRFRPPVYAAGKYTLKIGRDRPDLMTIEGVEPRPRNDESTIRVTL